MRKIAVVTGTRADYSYLKPLMSAVHRDCDLKLIPIITGMHLFSAALAALYLNITIAHINGGDVTGTTIDESIRHAITKIAHIHFAHTKKNAQRIERMGEQKNRIFVTG